MRGEKSTSRRAARRPSRLAVLSSQPGPAVATAGACLTRVDTSDFASAAELERLLDSLDGELRDILGMQVRQESYTLNRWLPTPRAARQPGRDLRKAGQLALIDRGRTTVLPTAGALVNTRPTGRTGVTTQLVHVAEGQALTRKAVASRIVVRDAPTAPVPYAALAEVAPARTRQILATLPGGSSERNVMVTNTDGQHLGAGERQRRPGGHGPLRRVTARRGPPQDAGARLHLGPPAPLPRGFRDVRREARCRLVEHLGTREILPVRWQDGPGERLRLTGRGEPYAVFAPTESPVLSTAMVRAEKGRALSRAAVLRGQDVPDSVRLPAQCSFGGIGTSFHSRLIPTIGGISGPWSLWAPAFGRRAVDPQRMRQQTLAIGDAVLSLGNRSRAAVAGRYPAERAARAAGVPTCDLTHPLENGPTRP